MLIDIPSPCMSDYMTDLNDVLPFICVCGGTKQHQQAGRDIRQSSYMMFETTW